MTGDNRAEELKTWACGAMQALTGVVVPETAMSMVSGDASFRRYFRLHVAPLYPALVDGQEAASSYLLVDAPPDKEDNPRFVRIADLFRDQGLRTPRVFAADYDQGFMLLEDFGDRLYLPALEQARDRGDEQAVDELYRQALDALLPLQTLPAAASGLPPYDRELLQREMRLFDEWFCTRLLGINLDESEQALLTETFRFIEDEVLRQPQVPVHRDYHSRNLMLLNDAQSRSPGIIDFQDAVIGSCLYDPVSLLRDCYIVWPPERVQGWLLDFAARARDCGIIGPCTDAAVKRDFDLMSLQRHLKVIGIFARLCLRDDKPRYLDDIPVAINYVMQVAPLYPELADFNDWFVERLLPLARERLQGLS